jgi:16S rRNA (uracil1498-N3)-methyltransferase
MLKMVEELTVNIDLLLKLLVRNIRPELPSTKASETPFIILIIQKTVELGVSRIVPVMMHRSVVQLTNDKAKKRTERYQSIAEAAAKQSRRGVIPDVSEPLSMDKAVEQAKTACDMILLPYENAKGMEHSRKVIEQICKGVYERTINSIGFFIGPEGGFEPSEVELLKQAGAEIISLGNRILRTETAGITMMSVWGFMLDE